MEVSRENLKFQLESFIYSSLKNEDYKVSSFQAIDLLKWNRLDLAFKLFYLEYRLKNESLASEIYKEDIRSQTLGSFQELGNDLKNSFENYVIEFNKTYENLRLNGFNKDQSLIPLSESFSIINGAHRVASAIHLGQKVSCVELDEKDMVCDYQYFKGRNVPNDILESVVNTFIKYSKNTHLAFLWPSGKENIKKSFSKFSNIIYQKDIVLTHQGAFNLLVELYKHMDWVGSKEKGCPQIHKKKIECFPSLTSFKVIAFQANSIEEVLQVKKEIREINNIGFSSIHITDTQEEAIRISRLIFNVNGLHFLNYGNPLNFLSELDKNEEVKRFSKKREISLNDIVLDSSNVLGLYGLRKSKDIDCFINGQMDLIDKSLKLETHDSELKHHEKSKEELIYNPKYHFHYEGVKYISFSQIFQMKVNRDGRKDKNDIELMEALMENNRMRKRIGQLRQTLFYFRIKVLYAFINPVLSLLRKMGVYNQVRRVYRKLKTI